MPSLKSGQLVAMIGGLCLLGFTAGPAIARRGDIRTSPPPNFKKVSTLVKLPDFVPGLGTLYVDPRTLPVGPFLGYDRHHKLVDVTYMVPLKELDARKNFVDLGSGIHVRVDHTSIEFNPGHPGLAEPHYHIIEWLVSPQVARKDVGAH